MGKMKKLLSILLAGCLCLSFAACSGNTGETTGSNGSADNGSANNSATQTEELSGAVKYVGRWEKCFYNNSDDPSFEEYNELTLETNSGLRYVEFYSNGTGKTSYYDGTICNGGGSPFKWTYDEENNKLTMTTAVADDEEPSGYYVYNKDVYDPTPKKAYILGEYDPSGHESVDYTEKVETISVCFYQHHEPMAKVDSDAFVDNPDLGCPDAFSAIDARLAE